MYRWKVKKKDCIGPLCMEGIVCRMDILEMRFFFEYGIVSFAMDIKDLTYKDYLLLMEKSDG